MPLNMILTVLIWLYNSNLNKQVLISLPGENLLALLRKLASSPKLADPGLDKHGTMVFFDVVGYFMVHYPQRIGVIINCALVAAVMFKVIRKGLGMSSSAGKFSRMISKWVRSPLTASVVSLSKRLYPHCLVLVSPQEKRGPHGRLVPNY